MVGVKKLLCRESKETETPSPPDAPWGCPTIDLVELTGILGDRLLNKFLTAKVSTLSLTIGKFRES